MKNLRLFMMLAVCLISLAMLAQTEVDKTSSPKTYHIEGLVVDTNGNPLSYPTVSLKKNVMDMEPAFRYSGLQSGKFSFEYTSVEDTVLLMITLPSKVPAYREVILKEDKFIDLAKILLKDGEELNSVAVVAYKPLVTQDVDRINYDVEADPESKTNSTLEMLRKVPMVTLDHEENILVKGSSKYKIYLNGKPSNMLTNNAKDILKSMPASSIKKIEVITDPGAKYDAEGVGAILNIVTQRAVQGYQGSIRADANSFGGFGLGGYFSSKIGKFGITANYNYGNFREKMWLAQNMNMFSQGASYSSMESKWERKILGSYNYGSLEMSYEFDSLNLISSSFGISGGRHKQFSINPSTTIFRNANGDVISAYDHSTNAINSNITYSGNVDYQKSFMKQGKLFTVSYNFNIDPINSYTISKNTENDSFPNALNSPIHNMKYISKGTSNEHTFQIDYKEPFNKNRHTVEGGVKYILRQNLADNGYKLFNETTNKYDRDTNLIDNDLRYYQHILGIYGSYSYRLQKFSMRLGGRFEGTLQDVEFLDNTEANFNVKYFDVVPYITFTYNPTFSSSLRLSYNNSISRPSIYYLNPYVDSQYPYIIKYGNPNLESERMHNISLSYGLFSRKFNINVSLNTSILRNAIQEYLFVDSEGILNNTYKNMGGENYFGGDLYLQYNPFRWLGMYTNSSISYVDITHKDYSHTGVQGIFLGGFTFSLPWSIKIHLNGGGSTKGYEYRSISPSWYYYSLGLSKSFLKEDRLTVGISANNIFDKHMNYIGKSWQEGVYETSYKYAQMGQRFHFRISWRFGEMKEKIKKAERGIKNDDLKGGDSSQGTGMPSGGGM